MADYRRILTLLLQGHSYRAVARMVGCSHRDVASATRAVQDHGITLERLRPPDFARVARSMRRNPHYTLLLAWRAYAIAGSEKRKYVYSQYCHLFNEYAQAHDLVATLHHQPGRVMFVDWAGDTIPIQDAITGQITPAYLFVAALPFSGLIFARAFANMRMEAWLDGHIGAFEAFGGVPQLVVPDHALTATHQRERGDAARFLHARYRQLTDHYGAAVLPARVRAPRDYPEPGQSGGRISHPHHQHAHPRPPTRGGVVEPAGCERRRSRAAD
jgi:transposase